MGWGGVHEKAIWSGGLPKRGGGLGQFGDLRGAWEERVDGVFEEGGGGGGGLIPLCIL